MWPSLEKLPHLFLPMSSVCHSHYDTLLSETPNSLVQTPVRPLLFSSQCLAQGQGQLPMLLKAWRLHPYFSWQHKMISSLSADIRQDLNICVVPHKYHSGPSHPFATQFIYRSVGISLLLHAYAHNPLSTTPNEKSPNSNMSRLKKYLKI